MEHKIVIYCDGGSRGNPGRAAIGVIVGDKGYGETIGVATNNVAEYSAVIFALKKAKLLLGSARAGATDVEVRMDSELLQKQLTEQYKVKNEELGKLFVEVWNLKQDFRSVTFVHIPRKHNAEADALVNRALDRVARE
ncbi:MAG: ribonuclease HI family protein [Candidatus Colwellbacteria bacterium]|nr:ribonuclease HI family protein [Candidatus Colwellbacteria bacterium]